MKDSYKYPAMMYALDNNALKVVEWLADNEEENIFQNCTSLIRAISHKQKGWKYLVRYAGRRGQNGTTALIEAAKLVNVEAVKALLSEAGMCDDQGRTALMALFEVNCY